MSETIPLFYWSERKFIFRDKENYGDLLSKYLVEKISEKQVRFVHPKKHAWYKFNRKHYLAIGSILHHATGNSIIWGSGIIDIKHDVAKADFIAVRGPRTRDFLLNKGYECPDVYGDPALLLPEYYNPVVEKRFKLGVIPHYHDYELANRIFGRIEDVNVIDLMTLDVEEVTRQILSCERCISSSLHGLIVSHAYLIPAVWIEFSSKLFGDGIKFQDYFESIGIDPYDPMFIENRSDFNEKAIFGNFPSLPLESNLSVIKKRLLEMCPFKSSENECN